MLRSAHGLTLRLHATAATPVALVQTQRQPSGDASPVVAAAADKKRPSKRAEFRPSKHAKRNQFGVQLLSRELHAQIFKNVSFPPPSPAFVRIAQEHLTMHGLDPKQGSVLPDTGFTLPPLQGMDINEHFHRLGARAAQPWLGLAQSLSMSTLPPRPECWHVQPGWTKYYFCADGSSYTEAVRYPEQQALVFDVETLPAHHPYPILACAASPDAWYAWISPWLLSASSDPLHLVPLGPRDTPRLVVGHSVSYDRQRVAEEYSVPGTRTRFLDTMALHVAVTGISSHQRPAWLRHRRALLDARVRREEAVELVLDMLRRAEAQCAREADTVRRAELLRLRDELEEGLAQLQSDACGAGEEEEDVKKSWVDLTAANSLADVARLHCGIDVDKSMREELLHASPAEVVDNISNHLSYCANDVYVTHQVFQHVLPAFLQRCPHPVSFAGALTMGSSFLTVDESWEAYLRDAERTYHELDAKVKTRLLELAEQTKKLADDGSWQDNPWLAQLDWTPKVAGKSRGVLIEDETSGPIVQPNTKITRPAWFRNLTKHGPLHPSIVNRVLPLLLKMSFDGNPLQYTTQEKWHYFQDGVLSRLPTAGKTKALTILSTTHGLPNLKTGRLSAFDPALAHDISNGVRSPELEERVFALAESLVAQNNYQDDPWLCQLDWSPVLAPSTVGQSRPRPSSPWSKPLRPKPKVYWPKWYWDLARPKKDIPPGKLDITVRNRVAPLLLQLSWLGWPLFYSRQHGWTFRVRTGPSGTPETSASTTGSGPLGVVSRHPASPLEFSHPADGELTAQAQGGYAFYKLPHKDGDAANVGCPLGKAFVKHAQDGTLSGPHPGSGAGSGFEGAGASVAHDALEMNAQCSYWISARDRILNQLVVWQDGGTDLGIRDEHGGPSEAGAGSRSGIDSSGAPRKLGMILPQVITMGTVTRRAIEKTWLTASNAKANRVGSELKAMVRAPTGYAIVGADVDSEELWISSCMGDAQFGLHGATALGWMTLEGSKAAGTDLHSKTASILGISRDQAKVFNYSRIYGAGMRHAVLLLLQANPNLLPEDAQKLAENLYASTKGKNTYRSDLFGRKFWYGGTESFVFNKLEEIALSDRPQTPALGCGITAALTKENLPTTFGCDFMTSRINWVVQSSGVDYLHLLIVAMDHLIAKYDIDARYLISVHDELRYLVAEGDKYRAALALQIANLWTRCLFAYKLGMDDLPQGVAFFSGVDVDGVLRKEVDMACVTPSHPSPIPPGESLGIACILERTHGGSLWHDGRAMAKEETVHCGCDAEELRGYTRPDCLAHRAESAAFLRAQATNELAEVRHLAQNAGKVRDGRKAGDGKRQTRRRREEDPMGPLLEQMQIDWEAVQEVLQSATT